MPFNKRNGFTLIELLVVVAIIGILAAIAMLNFKNAMTRAKTSAVYARMKTCQTAINAFMLENDNNPPYSNRTTVPYEDTPIEAWSYLFSRTCGFVIKLTTPVAYLSSLSDAHDDFAKPSYRFDEELEVYIPRSCFELHGTSNTRIRSRKGMPAIGSILTTSETETENATLGRIIDSKCYFILDSWGPDGDIDYSWINTSKEGNAISVEYILYKSPYSTSNGLYSKGNIIATNNVIVQ